GYSGNYGYLVVITHKNGFETRYAHLSKIKVKVGQKINSREIIALSGQTGRVSGPHLHYEVRKNGKVLNPTRYMVFNK
ncbi:MAG: M23 family metallopeptidase, partial [Fusobacteriaceae bacterium]